MPQPTENNRADCRVVVSDDKLSVFLSPIGDDAVELSLDAIQRRLAEAGLHIPPDRLNPFIQNLLLHTGLYRLESKVLVARGVPPVHARSARLEFIEPEQADASADPDVPDHYHRCHIRVVKAGQPLGKFFPAEKGSPGVDVFSNPIPFNAPKSQTQSLGQNISHDPSTQLVSAACDGSLVVDSVSVSVDPLIQVKNNVDFSTGNIAFPGDVLVGGNVADLFEVSAANISVHGAVEAAKLEARGNIHIDGGILGKEKGVVRAGADLAARFISNSAASAAGNITVLSEITNSRVSCGGKLTVARGSVVGGTLIANGGLEVSSLGAPSQVQTLIEVGADPQLLDFAAGKLDQIEKQRALIDKTRVSIEPLMKNLQRLTPQQREKATELLYNADEQENLLKKDLQELCDRWNQTRQRCSPEIVFHRQIFPGVTLRFPGQELTVRQTLNGPAKLMLKTIDSVVRIVILQGTSGSPIPLNSIPSQIHPIERRLKALMDASQAKAA